MIEKNKKIIILDVGGNELSNQLWNYASIYAYTLEKGYALENPSFFEYGTYFRMNAADSFFKILFFEPFRNYNKRKTALRRKIWRKIYMWYAKQFTNRYKDLIVVAKSPDNTPLYLPPTRESEGRLRELEKNNDNAYFVGWLFRNPVGMEKHRKEIKEYFTPRKDIGGIVDLRIKELKNRFRKIIGVHIRQVDYKNWRGGIYFVPQTRVREILDEYVKENKLDVKSICFLITSDGPIDKKNFEGLNVWISKEKAVTDLFLLSSTDAVIGSNSTFGAFASYLGNIPFIVMKNGKIDWEYYKEKTAFFENKYSTFVHY